jgi:hypothetical protein
MTVGHKEEPEPVQFRIEHLLVSFVPVGSEEHVVIQDFLADVLIIAVRTGNRLGAHIDLQKEQEGFRVLSVYG